MRESETREVWETMFQVKVITNTKVLRWSKLDCTMNSEKGNVIVMEISRGRVLGNEFGEVTRSLILWVKRRTSKCYRSH